MSARDLLQYIEAPDPTVPDCPSVFLGGGITNCPDWQSKVILMLRKGLKRRIAVFNPRRKNFPIDDPSASLVQIPWEFRDLRLAQVAAFWFSRGSINPIVLLEFGAAMERRQKIAIGIDPLYIRKLDVEMQLKLKRPSENISYDLESFAAAVRQKLKAA
jgi:hypothetical protein